MLIREWKNHALQYKEVKKYKKSSWKEPYSSSSFTKLSGVYLYTACLLVFRPGYVPIYQLSYMWYGPFAVFVTTISGLLASFLTGSLSVIISCIIVALFCHLLLLHIKDGPESKPLLDSEQVICDKSSFLVWLWSLAFLSTLNVWHVIPQWQFYFSDLFSTHTRLFLVPCSRLSWLGPYVICQAHV